MDLYMTEINFRKGYRYLDGDIDLKWSVDGLVLGDRMDSCLLDGIPYSGGSTIPWSSLHPGIQTLSCHDVEIPVTLRAPADEEAWICFVQRPDFPGDVRLDAYQAFFGARYFRRKLEGSLSEEFFRCILDAYDRIGLGTNNPHVMAQVRHWEACFMSFLAGELVNIDTEENPGRLLETVARIKNLSMK